MYVALANQNFQNNKLQFRKLTLQISGSTCTRRNRSPINCDLIFPQGMGFSSGCRNGKVCPLSKNTFLKILFSFHVTEYYLHMGSI